MKNRIALALAGLMAASVASADTMVWAWPDVTATWTGTFGQVYEDDSGGHVIFDADGEPVWSETQAKVFAAGFDEIHWSALITLPPGHSWEVVSGTCSYSVDGAGSVHTFTCQ
jgi:hypothetical protein